MRTQTKRIAIVILLLAGLWGLYQFANFSSRGSEGSPIYSSLRLDPYGTAAMVDLLRERGHAVRLVHRPRLEPGDRGTLIQVLPASSKGENAPAMQIDALMEWIGEGNTVVQFTRGETALMRRCNLATPKADGEHADQQQAGISLVETHELAGKPPEKSPGETAFATWSKEASEMLPGVRSTPPLVLQQPRFFNVEHGPAWRTIARWNASPVAGEFKVGKGRVIFVGAPTAVTNFGLAQGGNLPFLLALLGDQPVLVDEWSHGQGNAGTVIGMLVALGLMPAILQIAFVLGLYHWSTRGYRRPDILASPRRRASLEQVETLGHLYHQSLQPPATFDLVLREVLARLSGALRCAPAEIDSHLQRLKPEAAQHGREILEALGALNQAVSPPTCLKCGFNLTGNISGKCPECGTFVPLKTRSRVDRIAATPANATPQARAGSPPVRNTPASSARRFDAEFARVLTLTSEFAKEVARDRRSIR